MQHDHETRRERTRTRGGNGPRRTRPRFESEEHDYGGRWEGRFGRRDFGQRPPWREVGYEEFGGPDSDLEPDSGGYASDYDYRGWAHSHHYSNIFDEERGMLTGARQGRAGGRRRSFRGTGPKGYVRSDASIREDVCERLTVAPELDPSEVSVEVADGEVKLTGSVDTRWAKRYCEDLAYSVRGVMDVQNQLRITTRVR